MDKGNSTIKRTRLATALLAGIAAVGMTASANAATFYYDAYGGFINGTGTPAAGNALVENNANTRTGGANDVGADSDARNPSNVNVDVLWGTKSGGTNMAPYAGRSGLALSRVKGGTVVSDATNVNFGVLTHFNRPIVAGTSLTKIDMQWSLALFANATDATAAETSNNANAIHKLPLKFTVYNWETDNAGHTSGGGYYYSNDGGVTWAINEPVSNGGFKCPNTRPVGTWLSPSSSQNGTNTFISNGTDFTGSVTGFNGECSDAHTFTPKGIPETTFSYDDGTGVGHYSVVLSGFFFNGALTDTFWSCEEKECKGTVQFNIVKQPGPILPPSTEARGVPTLSEWAIILTSLMLAGFGWLAVRRRDEQLSA